MTTKNISKSASILSTSILCVSSMFVCSCSDKNDHNGQDTVQAHTAVTDEQEEHEEGIIVFSDEQARQGGVVTSQVGSSPVAGVIDCSGRILAATSDERTITSPLAGVVNFTGSITVGQHVTAGQPLFSISTTQIVQSDPTASLRADLANARVELDRVKEQYENRLITRAEYDQAVAAVNSAKAALANPGAAPIKHAVATAPVSGYITSTAVSNGSYVEQGTPLATVASNTRMQLVADLPNAQASEIADITSANIIMPDGSTISLSDLGATLISRATNSADGVYTTVTFEFDNPGSLVNGTPVEVKLLTSRTTESISVPREALMEEEGIYFVYVRESPEHYRKQQVRRGRDNGINVEVTQGLDPGQIIVTEGVTLLKLASNSGKAPQGHSHNH